MNNSSCPQRDLNSRPLDFEAIALTVRPLRPDTLSTCQNLTRFFLCLLYLHDNKWRSILLGIQYCTHITPVLFCGLTNNYKRALVHRLKNPVFVLPITDMSLIESESSYLAYIVRSQKKLSR